LPRERITDFSGAAHALAGTQGPAHARERAQLSDRYGESGRQVFIVKIDFFSDHFSCSLQSRAAIVIKTDSARPSSLTRANGAA
jgi:hypothetical protein